MTHINYAGPGAVVGIQAGVVTNSISVDYGTAARGERMVFGDFAIETDGTVTINGQPATDAEKNAARQKLRDAANNLDAQADSLQRSGIGITAGPLRAGARAMREIADQIQ